MAWADLLRRVYALDALACPRCAGRMRLIATITQVEVIRAILMPCGFPTALPERGRPL